MASNALQVLGSMNISAKAKQVLKNADQLLGEGIAAPFAVIGFKGGRWSIRHRGTTRVLERRDAQGRPDGFVPFLDLVVLQAATHHSKVYYAKNYQEGDDDVPDCWSTDGVKPDNAAPRKQASVCANCRWNEFGSRMNQATGAKGKACADTRRMAVVPYGDIENEMLGGPMLLRVPPASLSSVGEFSDLLRANSVPFSAIVTRVGFDPKESYPKFVFEPLQALTDEEVDRVAKMQEHPLCDRIVQEQVENLAAQPGSEQGIVTQPTNTGVVGAGEKPAPTPAPTPAQDDLTPPAHLRRNGAAQPAAATGAVTSGVTQNTQPTYSGNPFAAAVTAAAPAEPVQGQQPLPLSQPTQPANAAPAVALTPEQLRIAELERQLAEAKTAQATPRKRRTQPVAPAAVAEAAQPTQAEGEPEEDGAEPVNDPALAAISARLSKVIQ